MGQADDSEPGLAPWRNGRRMALKMPGPNGRSGSSPEGATSAMHGSTGDRLHDGVVPFRPRMVEPPSDETKSADKATDRGGNPTWAGHGRVPAGRLVRLKAEGWPGGVAPPARPPRGQPVTGQVEVRAR